MDELSPGCPVSSSSVIKYTAKNHNIIQFAELAISVHLKLLFDNIKLLISLLTLYGDCFKKLATHMKIINYATAEQILSKSCR